MHEADDCLTAATGMNLENKIVLAMAIRLLAERYMIGEITKLETIEDIEANQARHLTEKFRTHFSNQNGAIEVLDRVALMTPENIHVNSFMYEPIIDLSDDHLKKLYQDVKQLAGNLGEPDRLGAVGGK